MCNVHSCGYLLSTYTLLVVACSTVFACKPSQCAEGFARKCFSSPGGGCCNSVFLILMFFTTAQVQQVADIGWAWHHTCRHAVDTLHGKGSIHFIKESPTTADNVHLQESPWTTNYYRHTQSPSKHFPLRISGSWKISLGIFWFISKPLLCRCNQSHNGHCWSLMTTFFTDSLEDIKQCLSSFQKVPERLYAISMTNMRKN